MEPVEYCAVEYWKQECPNLAARVDSDAENGLFNYNWRVGCAKSNEYFEGLLGRKIKMTDRPYRVFDKIEEMLAK